MTPDVIDRDLLTSLDSYFSDTFGHDVVANVEGKGLDEALWAAIARLDLPGIGIRDDRGGSGGELPQLVAMLQAAGRHSVPLPLVENHVAAWLLTKAGVDLPDGPSTIVPGSCRDDLVLQDGRLHGAAHQVAWAATARRVVAVVRDETGTSQMVAVNPADLEIGDGVDLAGQPRGTLRADGAQCLALPTGHTAVDLSRRAGLLRAAQVAGALETVASQTLTYVRERGQFGHAIGSFQSVQQHVVTIQQMATMTALCVERAVTAAQIGHATFELDALRLLVAQNAAAAARAAHQAHGAIGMTQEFALQHLTRRLNTWRWDFGDPREVAARIGATVNEVGSVRDVITAAPSTMEVRPHE